MLATIFFGPVDKDFVYPRLNVGDMVTLKKVVENGNTAVTWHFGGTEYGKVSRSNTYMLSGAEPLTDEIYNAMPEESTAEIKAIGSVEMGLTRPAYAIHIKTFDEEVEMVESNSKTLKFKVTGSNIIHSAKAFVLQKIASGDILTVNIRLENNNLNVYCSGIAGTAGIINPERDNDTDAIKMLKAMLQAKDNIEATTLSVTATSYDIEVVIESEVLNNLAKNELDEEYERIVAAGICSMAELKRRENYAFNIVGLSEQQWCAVVKTYKVYPEKVRHRIPNLPEKVFHDKTNIIYDSIMYIKRKKHLIFYGNKGTGKNHAVEVLAALFNRPLFSTAINRDTDKMDQLGSKTIEAIETDSGNVIQKVVFEPSIVLEAMEVGGFCLLDEINCADNAVMKLLNGIMDTRRTIEVPGYRSVTADEYFAVIGTMNVGYSGTNKLSPELNDRVARIHFIEHSTIKPILLEACPNANLKLVNICDKVYQEIKRRVDITELLEECLTIRGFIDALEVSDDIPLKRALLRSVADKIDDEQMHGQLVDIINLNVI